uniref:FLYWCH-type domain-containing protein n=1 Tax=Meloidogyne incognita TaxID=6306 RepID=A0A914MXX1_MELIC
MASFVKSNKNGEKLIYDGFIYVKCKNGPDNKRYWRCEFWRSHKCNGFAVTDSENMVTVTKQHDHERSPNRVELAKIKDRIVQAAVTTTLSPREIVNNQIAGISDQAKAELPKLVNLEKTVGRKRFADGQPVPRFLSEIDIPENLRRTKTNISEDFILVDTGADDCNRIIIFASPTDVARLSTSDVWLCDGTFKNDQQLFYQLWIISGQFYQPVVLPFVYILLPSKTTESYLRALELLIAKIDEMSPGYRPHTVIFDFEKAEEQALQTALPFATIHGCFFQFKQALWRKIQELGWGKAEIEGLHNYLKMFVALTFVDTANVPAFFNQLAQRFLEIFGNGDSEGPHVAFINYMERNWIGKDFMPPRFPLSMWNSKDITYDQMPRATNSVESWHFTFAGIFYRHSSNPYNLVKAILNEQLRVDAIAVRIVSGEEIRTFSRPEYKRTNDLLLDILKGVGGPRDPIEYLTACSYYIPL